MVLKVNFEQLTDEMARAVMAFRERCAEFNPKDKTGGVLVYADINGKEIRMSLICPADSDTVSCYETARRKIKQMADNPGHISSYLSRDPENGLWGGGIHVWEVGLFAFSGLPELADEACLLKALENCGLITDPQIIVKVLAWSENKIYERLG